MNEYQEVFRSTMPIRWGDMDAFGHVNNTVYFRYVEQLRIDWLEASAVPMRAGQGPVIVTASMNFRKQLHYPGQVLCVMSAKAPGRSSIDTLYELRRSDDPDVVYADGGARIVWVDYAAGKSVSLPDVLRALLPRS
ncbi:acyl-CoA thioesterase [Robbsia sp. Bb-Pol-6]|uniref:Acyl-CoA thioesterase n=1 Tax=Robbsia betulipollinis TaxID=2981849 RepID=A0ABT3ZPI8_9BURK|nr:acyl-CoA thioesterase [Robbsia betulipollinis]MCY0388469.1 acyl-CoA thioesterase [Robbsia betulipollinis]